MGSYENLWKNQGKKVSVNGEIYRLGATEFVTTTNEEITHLALWEEEDWNAEQPPSILIRDSDDEFPSELINAYSKSVTSAEVSSNG